MNHTISTIDFQRAARLGAIIGHHHYFQVGVYDAVRLVKDKCPQGVTVCDPLNMRGKNSFPHGFFRVGQVVVHHGDQPFPLIVDARQWLQDELAAGR